MAGKTRKRRKREPLVFAHLERVSRSLLEKHPDIVKKLIGRNSGIYALYRKTRLYYVGLTTRLTARLKAHVRDRHSKSWDNFSIYLTIKDQHLKEIETLLLQIGRPTGNRVGGKPGGSKNMKDQIQHAIRAKQNDEVEALFNRARKASTARARKTGKSDEKTLARILPNGAKLRANLRGQTFKAKAYPDGRIRFGKVVYNSLSQAAVGAIGRPTNGWWFWKVERGKGHWIRLKEARRVGTPIYVR